MYLSLVDAIVEAKMPVIIAYVARCVPAVTHPLYVQLSGITWSHLSARLHPQWTGCAADESKDNWNCWDTVQSSGLPVRVCIH